MTEPPRTSSSGLIASGRALLGAYADYAGWRGVRAGALVASGAVLDGFGLLLLVPILNVVVSAAQGQAHRGWIGRTLAGVGAVTPVQQLLLLLTAFVALSVLRSVVAYGRDTSLGHLQTGFIEAERARAMQIIAEAPWPRVVGLRHARVTNLITSEIQRLNSASYFLIQGVVQASMLVIQAAIAFSLAPALAAVAMVLVAIGAVTFVITQRTTHDLGGSMVRANQALMGSAAGFLAGLKTAAAQNARPAFVAEFATIQRRVREGQLRFQVRQARGRLVFGLVSSLLGAGVVLAGFAWLQVPPALLIALVLVFGRMSGPAMQLYQSGQQLVFALPSFESMRGLEAELLDGGSASAIAPVAPPAGAIDVIDASYEHPGGRGVRHASLAIAPGSFVGIAGPSGAGKTTLVDLIVGLLEPQSGEVRIGGERLDDARRAGWAQGIAYVSQEGFLFHDTVRANLLWANDAPSDAAIADALAQAGAAELVARMPQGLDTVMGERGTLLSGGERQRIGLARALLRKPRLLVLDEAANAIDAPAEAALLDRLAALDPRPTIVMISHREESLRWCDRVIRVEDGIVSG
ncbi:ABC transporter ATP-binding protein [Sphingomonas sp.]|uniref:ABC transporter ATP-binding protein n=1 Tax=Sphingomonas sp. TaxID=28214 RepID=UPI001B289F18|nr:ABC transporter ATP-binding protein [Sphingomonas sp.]MBO9711571.1 ABC transporter ATP-binding protein [Sphingomonas sp.]